MPIQPMKLKKFESSISNSSTIMDVVCRTSISDSILEYVKERSLANGLAQVHFLK